MAEKIRSIFQRTRPRDLYDIWQLSSQVDRDQVKSILNRKCEYKGVVLDISRVLERSDEFKASWDASLRHQMNQIPDFQVAFAGVTESIGRYLG